MRVVPIFRALAIAGVAMGCSLFANAQGGSCKDPWINQAYNQLYHRAPSGSGLTGECNTTLYGGGHWTTFADLESKIIAVRGRPTAVQAPAPAPALKPAPAPAPAPVTTTSALMHLDQSGNLLRGTTVVAPKGTFDLVDKNGVMVNVAKIVAAGGGNIVAAGGGNMRSLESVGGRPKYVVQ